MGDVNIYLHKWPEHEPRLKRDKQKAHESFADLRNADEKSSTDTAESYGDKTQTLSFNFSD